MVVGHFGTFDLMRTMSKPSTAKCTLEHYTAFLLAEPQSAGCVPLAEVAGDAFAHDAANRFPVTGRDLSGGIGVRWTNARVRNIHGLDLPIHLLRRNGDAKGAD
jgi:hypothetical protein